MTLNMRYGPEAWPYRAALTAAMMLAGSLPAAASPLAYVPISQPPGVQVIDPETSSVVATIPLAATPSQLAITPDGRFVYVAQSGTISGGFGNAVAIIATNTNSVAGSITAGEQPGDIAIGPTGQFVYVANTDSNSISVIATSTNSAVKAISAGSGPTGLAFSPDGSFLYVANAVAGSVSVVDTGSNAVVYTIPVGGGSGDLAISPNGKFIYTADSVNGGISVIDTAARAVVNTVNIPVNARGIVVAPDGTSVYVVSGTAAAGFNVSVMDTATNTIKANVPLNTDAQYGQLAISPDGALVYVTCTGSGIIVIATATNTVLNSIPVDNTSGRLLFAPAQGASLSSLTLNPTAIIGGAAGTGTVSLTGAAPGAAIVSLSSGDSSVTLPASVTVSAGAQAANFAVETQPVAYPNPVTLTAAMGNVSKTATITVTPASGVVISAVSVSPSTLIGGTAATGTVTLTAAAPAGGIAISLWTNGAAALVPAELVIPQGATSGSFSVTTMYTAATAYDTVTAFYNGVSKGTVLTINPVLALASVRVNSPLVGGTSATGTVTLNAGAPSGGATVDLWTDGTPAFVPFSITIPAGFNTGTFAVSTVYTSSLAQRTVTAFFNGSTQTASLTVTPVLGIASIAVAPSSVAGGASVVGSLTLTTLAPAGGIEVQLWTSGWPTFVSPTITIPAGSSSATSPVTTARTHASAQSAITAFYNGSLKSTILTVSPAAAGRRQ